MPTQRPPHAAVGWAALQIDARCRCRQCRTFSARDGTVWFTRLTTPGLVGSSSWSARLRPFDAGAFAEGGQHGVVVAHRIEADDPTDAVVTDYHLVAHRVDE